ncbi:hypothetical protein AVEN_153421-1 [Araneus ventricosus]|uniref:Integrase catalytic domain-containing protein n=1 Tax=Araneus ventricosus TaxID=182803 RepID=A0A4Y2EAB5_ARAVE|nr:hypothetical protein AVEN_153421-1 [Araneus ventricosus]
MRNFRLPSAHSSHAHVDVVGPLSPIQGVTYLLTCVKIFTRWPEAFPIPYQSADTIARAFLLFLGAEQSWITAYHPQSVRAVERFHRQLKSALKTHLLESWLDAIPLVLVGIRTSFKENLATSSAELVYGSTLKLPEDFFIAPRSLPTSHHCSGPVFVSGDILTASHVFLSIGRIPKSLEPPYAGPYKVLSRTSEVFTMKVDGRPVTVSIDRLKEAHMSQMRLLPGFLAQFLLVVPRSLMSSLNIEDVHCKLFISRLDCLRD